MAVLYSKAWGGLHLLLRAYGSAIPRTLLASLLSTALSALLFYVPGGDYFQGVWRHPYPYQLFAFILGFVLVFRSNLGYSRFWEGRSQLQVMSAHWADLVVKALAFEAVTAAHTAASAAADSGDSAAGPGGGEGAVAQPPAGCGQACGRLASAHGSVHSVAAREARERLGIIANQLVHLASLLHALCLLHLRRDWCLANLETHTPGCPPPPADARGLPGYRVGWLQLLTLRSGRESRMAYHRAMPLAVLGGVTAEERRLLGEGRESAGGVETETLLTGLDLEFLQRPETKPGYFARLLRKSFQVQTGVSVEGANVRSVTAYTWLHLLLAQRVQGWELAPPTTAGVFVVLSQGWAAFESCRQARRCESVLLICTLWLLMHYFSIVTLPVMICGWLHSIWLVLVMNFVSVLTYWALNEVARDLEDCFLYDPNDAPLARLQWEFNGRLLAAARAAGAHGSETW